MNFQDPIQIIQDGTLSDLKKWTALGWDYNNSERLRFFGQAILNNDVRKFDVLLKWAQKRDKIHGFDKDHPRALNFFENFYVNDKETDKFYERVVNLLVFALEEGCEWFFEKIDLNADHFKNLPGQVSGYLKGRPLSLVPPSWTPWVCLKKPVRLEEKFKLLPYFLEKGLELPTEHLLGFEKDKNSLAFGQWFAIHQMPDNALKWLKMFESLGLPLTCQDQSNRISPWFYVLRQVPYSSLETVKTLQSENKLHMILHDCQGSGKEWMNKNRSQLSFDWESCSCLSSSLIEKTKTPSQWLWVFWWNASLLDSDKETQNEVIECLKIFAQEKALPHFDWFVEFEQEYLHFYQKKERNKNQEWLNIQLNKVILEEKLEKSPKKPQTNRL